MSGSLRTTRWFLFVSVVAIAALAVASCNLPVSSLSAANTPLAPGASAPPGPYATSQQALKARPVTSYHGCGPSDNVPDTYYMCPYHDFRVSTKDFSYVFTPPRVDCAYLWVGRSAVWIETPGAFTYDINGDYNTLDSVLDVKGHISADLAGTNGSCSNGVVHLHVKQTWADGKMNFTLRSCCVKSCNPPPSKAFPTDGPSPTEFDMDIPLSQVVAGMVVRTIPVEGAIMTGNFSFVFAPTDHPDLQPIVPFSPVLPLCSSP